MSSGGLAGKGRVTFCTIITCSCANLVSWNGDDSSISSKSIAHIQSDSLMCLSRNNLWMKWHVVSFVAMAIALLQPCRVRTNKNGGPLSIYTSLIFRYSLPASASWTLWLAIDLNPAILTVNGADFPDVCFSITVDENNFLSSFWIHYAAYQEC